MFWTTSTVGGLVTNLTPYASVGSTAAGLYARRYGGGILSSGNAALPTLDTAGTPIGPSGIDTGPGYSDSYCIGLCGYVHAPTGGTFSAAVASVDDTVVMWVGRLARRGFSMTNWFATGSTNPNPVPAPAPGFGAGTASLRPGYTPIRICFQENEGGEALAWSITLPPGASFVHATAGLGF